MDSISSAAAELRKGGFVVLHDGEGRENEADMVCLATKTTPSMVRRMRKEAGGLICLAMDMASSRRLKIPFAYDVLRQAKNPLLFRMCRRKMKYGDMPVFTISINHLSTFTGITDNDRSKTIREFGRLIASKGGTADFRRNFRSIGHVFLLTSRGLENRRGHTELSVELSSRAGMPPAVVLCEMLSDSGRAASKNEARAYAKKNGYPFLEGKDLVEG